MTETKRLGRGLEALLGPVSREQAEASGALRELPMAQVRPNPYQPRTRIDEPAIGGFEERLRLRLADLPDVFACVSNEILQHLPQVGGVVPGVVLGVG